MDTAYPESIGGKIVAGTQAVLVLILKDPLEPATKTIINDEYVAKINIEHGHKLAVVIGNKPLVMEVTGILPSSGNIKSAIIGKVFLADGIEFGNELPSPWQPDRHR